MGTRGLTAVVKNGDFKVAQYGQWDHYPSGQGNTILTFLNSANLARFSDQLDKIEWADEDEVMRRWASVGADDSGWVNLTVSRSLEDVWPWLSRSAGAEVLRYIYEGRVDILQDSRGFAADSLFCEWAYVVDLDNRTLTVYRGFQTEPHDKAGHFAGVKSESDLSYRTDQYAPVARFATYSLNNLPISFVETYDEETDETVYLALDKDGNSL